MVNWPPVRQAPAASVGLLWEGGRKVHGTQHLLPLLAPSPLFPRPGALCMLLCTLPELLHVGLPLWLWQRTL